MLGASQRFTIPKLLLQTYKLLEKWDLFYEITCTPHYITYVLVSAIHVRVNKWPHYTLPLLGSTQAMRGNLGSQLGC